MVVRRRKKVSRQRGSRTHGWGLVHRGSGNRGGVGNAGKGKKSHCKKPQIWGTDYLGKHGFVKHDAVPVKAISIMQIEQSIGKWLAAQLVTKQQDVYSIDLSKMGFTKLLSNGRLTKKLNVKVASASSGAVEKIKSAGGTVVQE